MSGIKVRQVMERPGIFIDGTTLLVETARLMRDLDLGCLLVGSPDRLVGIVTDRDLVVRSLAQGQDSYRIQVETIMSREPICCDADQTTDTALKIMVECGVRRLPVRNRTDRVIGLISRSDIGFPPSNRKPYQINFYKNVQAGSISRPVLMDTVYVSGCPDPDAALEMACQRIVDAHGVASWDQFADQYEIFDLGDIYR